MGSRLRSKLSYANVVATLALFVALGGSAFAAVALTRNSVKSKHIGAGQVKRSDIGKGAVNSSKVKNLSLLAKDFKAGQLPAGAKGDQGPPGLARMAVTLHSSGAIYKGSLEGGSVRRAATGQYCFELPFPVTTAVATRSTEVAHPADRDQVAAAAVNPEATCLPSEEILVTVTEIDANDNGTIDNTFVNKAFSLMVN